MINRYALVPLAGLCAVCVGCGSSSQSTASRLPLNAYLVKGREETGLEAPPNTTVFQTVAQWASGGNGQGQDPGDVQRLTREGFREAMSVNTAGVGPGLSWVIELSSAGAATHEQAAELAESINGASGVKRFTVSGIPNADGFTFYPGAASNVLFTEGRCVMLVGAAAGSASKPAVTAGVRAIWARTHNKPSVCSG